MWTTDSSAAPQMQQRLWEKQRLRRQAGKGAAAALCLFGMEFLLSAVQDVLRTLFPAFWERFAEALSGSIYLYLAYYAVIYLLSMGVPVLIGCLLLRGQLHIPHARTNPGLGCALVAGGMALCIGANLITNYILNYLQAIGIVPNESPVLQDGSVGAMLLNLLIIAVFPAVLEELLFRGVVLSALRPAGDRIAVGVSALMFGLMHTTLYQIPFAFLLGLVFGYVVVRTGNIRIAMALHFCNNAMSVLAEYATWNFGENAQSVFYNVLFACVALAGSVALCVLIFQKRPEVFPLGERPLSPLSSSERRRAVWCSPWMIVFTVATLLMTMTNLTLQQPESSEPSDVPSVSSTAPSGSGERLQLPLIGWNS